jgi:diguanylate cyclase (GGDEF)-like protein/PAS domain S-box-containing protein
MHSILNLDHDCMNALSDVHAILMTWQSDESAVLQKICDKLLSSRTYDLVWIGLLNSNGQFSITGAAGEDAEQIKGLCRDSQDFFTGCKIKQCLASKLPVLLPEGLAVLNNPLFDGLPSEIKSLPASLYPLMVKNTCVGIIAVSARKHGRRKRDDHWLLQLTAQNTGFTLGLFQALVAKKNSQSHLKLAAAVFDNSLEGIVITDVDGTILAANAAVTQITGYQPEELIGKNPRILKSGRHHESFYTALWDSVRRNGQWEGEVWNKHKNGEVYPERISISAIKDEQGEVQNYIGIFIDISKQKEAESHLFYQSYHDTLTSLPNRALFQIRLDWAILQAKLGQTGCAVLFIDLDYFKYINDSFGHTMGDLLLQKIAVRLKACLRENDTLSRMGGDEFTVILEDFANRNDVEQTAARIIAALDNPFLLDNQELFVSASIGISFFPEDGDDATVLMKHADAAMYKAKNDGRKQLQFFQSGMESYSAKRIEMERYLRYALEHNEFRLFYQPQVNLGSGHIVGAEALLRWQRPGVGLVPPDQFIPLAEETGIIVPIGQWVLQEACRQCKIWQQAGWQSFRMGVNLSTLQFRQANLNHIVELTLIETGLAPQYLDLELTESLAMQQVENSLKTLLQLKQQGVQLSIDDFGTGYSSLSYLKQFPIDRLKIDRSFISDIANDPNDAAIVEAIIAMAHCLGLKVIAEGVETEEQLNFLKMRGCDEVQGYLFGQPVSAEMFFHNERLVY